MNETSSKPVARSRKPITLDSNQILNQAGGDPQMMVQLCAMFLSNFPLHRDRFAGALQKKDYFGANRQLQQLRSCLLLFGPGRLSCTLDLLEDALRTRRVRQLQREYQMLKGELELLVPQVQRLMLEMSSPQTAVQ